MLLIRKPGNAVPAFTAGSVATIGAYDGLHLGHRRILSRVIGVARERDLPAVIMSFEPTPKEFFSREAPPARLMNFRDKYLALEELGVDVFYCPPFNARMAGLSPDQFIDRLLLGVLRVKHLVVGDDFRFAHKRSGSIDDLQRRGAATGFTVEQVPSVMAAGQRVSSSVVREALRGGDLERAAELLGRRYRMAGRVVSGAKLGRQLGMPTANVRLNRAQSPLQGIFAVRVSGVGANGWRDGVASIGTRPTVDGVEPLLEVHIFDFDGDIYGAHIQVEFVARLRDEVRFPDLDALTARMKQDAAEARELLGRLRENAGS